MCDSVSQVTKLSVGYSSGPDDAAIQNGEDDGRPDRDDDTKQWRPRAIIRLETKEVEDLGQGQPCSESGLRER